LIDLQGASKKVRIKGCGGFFPHFFSIFFFFFNVPSLLVNMHYMSAVLISDLGSMLNMTLAAGAA
jgi:hypothetical protein